MTVSQGAVDATFAAFGIEAVYTPAGSEPVPVRVIARRPDTIVGFGETGIHAEIATFEVRASETARPHSHNVSRGARRTNRRPAATPCQNQWSAEAPGCSRGWVLAKASSSMQLRKIRSAVGNGRRSSS
jgi:hypothetical protein